MNISDRHRMFDQQTRRLLRNIATPFLIVASSGEIVWANSPMAQLLGVAGDELIDKSLQSFARNEEQAVLKLLRLFSSSGSWLVGSLKLSKGDGNIVDFPCEGSVFQPATASQKALIGIRSNQQLQFQALNRKIEELNAEIRRRMQVEAALRDSEIRIRTLVDCSPLAIQVFAADGSVLRVNKAWERMWQSSLSALRNYQVFQDQQLAELGILALLKRVFQGESLEFPSYEYDKSRKPDIFRGGGKLCLRVFGYPIIATDGCLQEVVVIQEDVTDKVKLERELEQHRHHLETLVEARTAELRRHQAFTDAVLNNISDGIVACDERGMLSMFNRATREMHGIGQASLPPEQWASHYRLLQLDGMTPMSTDQVPLFRAFQGKPVQGQELVIERADGSKLTVLCAGQAMMDQEGRKIGAVVSMHDITLQKQAQAQMIQAKEAAEAANRAKSVFLANMSHELRTPLNAILGFSQLMENDERIPEDERRNIEAINRSGTHLLSLINDVLEISRIEAGRTQVINEAFDLIETIHSIREMTALRAAAAGLSLVVEVAGDLPNLVTGDEHHLRQVLLNLLNNAIKYTEHGEVHLSVKPQSEQTICFEVADTGRGIAEDQKARIFETFYQIDGNATTGEGAGLGLSLSQKFVTLMGGELSLHSTLGQGSSFRFSLPLARADKRPASRKAKVTGLAAGQSPPRILLADDNLDNQQVVKQLLERIGCEVFVSCNGLKAVEIFQSWQPELILMDMRMPVMDGYRATRTIRSLPGGDKLPILALTASAFEEDRSRVLASGCNEIIRKPVEAARLYEMLARMLNLTFEYAPESTDDLPTRRVETLTTLNNLPPELREELADAAAILDVEATQAIVERLRADYPDEAELISSLIERYRFDKLIEACVGK